MNQIHLNYLFYRFQFALNLLDSDLFNSTQNTKQIDFRLIQHLFAICKYIFLVCIKLTALIIQLED